MAYLVLVCLLGLIAVSFGFQPFVVEEKGFAAGFGNTPFVFGNTLSGKGLGGMYGHGPMFDGVFSGNDKNKRYAPGKANVGKEFRVLLPAPKIQMAAPNSAYAPLNIGIGGENAFIDNFRDHVIGGKGPLSFAGNTGLNYNNVEFHRNMFVGAGDTFYGMH